MRIRSPRDFWAGVMFMGVGLFFAAWAAAHYQMGSAVRMGPAYFPVLLGGLLAILGAIVLLGSLAVDGPKLARFNFRPLVLIVAANLAYAYAIKPLGLVLATVALVIIAALGGHEFKWREVIILAIVLIAFSVVVFVKGLTLPFPLWPAFLGY